VAANQGFVWIVQMHGSEVESIAALQEGCNSSITLRFDCDTILVRNYTTIKGQCQVTSTIVNRSYQWVPGLTAG